MSSQSEESDTPERGGTIVGGQEVADPDELDQKLRLRSLNEARQKVRHVRNNAREQFASASGQDRARSNERGAQVYLDIVKSYALELLPMLRDTESSVTDETLLTSTVAYSGSTVDGKDIIEIEPAQARVEISGLEQLMRHDFPIVMSYQATVMDSAQGKIEKTVTESWNPTFAEIDLIVMAIDSTVLDEHGLGLTPPNEVDGKGDMI